MDELYWGTCVQKATAVMSCPMNVAGLEQEIDALFRLPVTMGTHDY